jgi:hypothetical protein
MGTFRANATVFSVGGSPGIAPSYISINNPAYVVGLTSPSYGQGNQALIAYSVSSSGTPISLDGNPAIAVQSLPAGFNIFGPGIVLESPTTTYFGYLSQQTGGGAIDGDVIATAAVQYSVYGPTAQQLLFQSLQQRSVPINEPTISNTFRIIDLIGLLTVNIISTVPTVSGIALSNVIVVTGSYTIISTKWVINNLTNPGKEFVPGDTAQVTSSDGSYDFSTITKVTINSTDITVFTVQTAAKVQFLIPPDFPPPPGSYPVTITNPSAFSGDALVGYVTVVTADASGVYTLTPGATHDTVYISSQTDGITNNVAIPNPFASTGFING